MRTALLSAALALATLCSLPSLAQEPDHAQVQQLEHGALDAAKKTAAQHPQSVREAIGDFFSNLSLAWYLMAAGFLLSIGAQYVPPTSRLGRLLHYCVGNWGRAQSAFLLLQAVENGSQVTPAKGSRPVLRVGAGVLLLSLLAAPARAQDSSPISQVIADVGSGTVGTYDKGHVALQWGPIAGVAIAQPEQLLAKPSSFTTTAGKTGFMGVALTLSFWPRSGGFLAHVSAFAAAAFGAADVSTHAPVAGALGLVVSCGGVGVIPPIGIGVLQPVAEGAGAGIPMLPELVLTGQLPNLLAKLAP